ncbi:MAG: hypothetical protein ACJ790_13020, partial [Myxococcaceae bacterium]
SAFGESKGAKLSSVSSGKQAAFDVTVSKGDEVKTVQVNNFGRPIPAGVDPREANVFVANYFLDSFA